MKRFVIVMSLVVVMTSAMLSGCEPFPSDEPVSSSSADKPTKTPETQKAPAVNTPVSTNENAKPSDASPTQSTTTSTSVDKEPVVEQKEVQSTTSTENTPAAKPEESEPVEETVPEDDEPKLAPNAGKLQIIGTAGKDVYYMKKVEQPDANCYVVSNSVTWDTSVSCVPADNVHMKKEELPPVTTVTSGK